MRRTVLVVPALLALACTGAPPQPEGVPKPAAPAEAAPAKPGAPVALRSSVQGGRVRLELTFASAGRGVTVRLRGTEGLLVAGDPEPVRGRSVSAGETLLLDVGVAPGPGHSNLAVLVSGTFGGEPRARALSVGFGRLQREDVSAFDRRDDGHGQPLKLGRGRIR